MHRVARRMQPVPWILLSYASGEMVCPICIYLCPHFTQYKQDLNNDIPVQSLLLRLLSLPLLLWVFPYY